jgi:murein DD-endopeptidase MepM/ murein hydrolase activator NlpD
VIIPKDEIYSILDGVVVIANDNANRSGYGKSVTVQHRFADGTRFISMYAHLDRLDVKTGQKVEAGERIGWMGATSSSPGGRAYLRMIPHLHFEVGKVIREAPSLASSQNLFTRVFLRLLRTSNIQPYNPIEFLQRYHAQPKSQWSLNRTDMELNPSS